MSSSANAVTVAAAAAAAVPTKTIFDLTDDELINRIIGLLYQFSVKGGTVDRDLTVARISAILCVISQHLAKIDRTSIKRLEKRNEIMAMMMKETDMYGKLFKIVPGDKELNPLLVALDVFVTRYKDGNDSILKSCYIKDYRIQDIVGEMDERAASAAAAVGGAGVGGGSRRRTRTKNRKTRRSTRSKTRRYRTKQNRY
jgi:hypothetical protein